jgi:hypothetical protein
MKKIALIITFSLALFSCEKEKQLIVENTDIPLISKVLIAGVSYYEYSYNDANLLIEEKSKFHYTKHNYNDNNLLSSSDFYMDAAMFSSDSRVVEASMNRKEWVNPDNTAKSLSKSFEYNDKDQTIKVTYNRPSVSNSEYSLFTFENERISRQTMYWQNAMSFYIDYIYDEKGNLTKESKYYVPATGIGELWTTTEYEYDNMHNPFQAFKRLMSPSKFTNPNNITKETYTIYFEVDQWTQKVQLTNNTYEYNNSGYPIKVNGEAEYVYK